MGELGKWANDNNQFFKLELGQSVQAVYKGFKIIPNKFDPEKDIVRYELEINGIKKFWENGSLKVAQAFDTVKFGQQVKITREHTNDGKGKYFVQVLTEDSINNVFNGDL